MSSEPNSDELAAFVTSTLKAIAAGIADAQNIQIESVHGTGVSGYAAPEQIEFDIAVSAKKSEAAGGGLKISVFGVGAKVDAKSGSENSTISRIKFAIPSRFKKTPNAAYMIPSTVTAFNQ